MKKHLKFFKMFTVLLCMVISAIGIRTDVFAATETWTTSYTCGKALCFKNTVATGPVETSQNVPSEVPSISGKPISDYYGNLSIPISDVHVFFIYCPKYSASDTAYLRHAMTIYWLRHSFTVSSYEQETASTHITHYTCTGNGIFSEFSNSETSNAASITQETANEIISDTHGCGKEKSQSEPHVWTYGNWTDSGNGNHIRTKTCSCCGYSTNDIQSHGFDFGEWEYYFTDVDTEYSYAEYHKRDGVCSVCGAKTMEFQKHSTTELTEWKSYSDTRHKRSKYCTICNYTWNYTDYHHFTNVDTHTYEKLDETQHTVYEPCDECEYIKSETQAHVFLASDYTQYSDKQHKSIQTCVCGEQRTIYEDHSDSNNDCYCDECGYLMTRFSVTVPTTLNFVMSESGEVFSADNAQIINNSSAAVSVKQVNLEAINGWSLTEYNETAIASAKVDSKIIGLKINSAETSSSGQACSFEFDDWVIEKEAYAQIPYDAVVSATSTPIENEQVMNAVFIVDWKTNY